MPTYEYRCPNGHDFEQFAKISESQAVLPCPQCGAEAARRISGGAGLLFKGTGFYITDYGKDGKKDQKAATAKTGDGGAAGGGDGGGGGDTKSGDAKGGEGKPDAKTGSDAPGKPAAPPAAASSRSPKPPSSSSSSGGDA